MSDTKHSINKNYPKRKKAKTRQIQPKDINSMPDEMRCICGGGQSCLIDRRWIGEWVHEDNVFTENGISLRDSCMEPYNIEQEEALSNNLAGKNSIRNTRKSRSANEGDLSRQSILDRWNEDANSERL